jgi:hypothetical protein
VLPLSKWGCQQQFFNLAFVGAIRYSLSAVHNSSLLRRSGVFATITQPCNLVYSFQHCSTIVNTNTNFIFYFYKLLQYFTAGCCSYISLTLVRQKFLTTCNFINTYSVIIVPLHFKIQCHFCKVHLQALMPSIKHNCVVQLKLNTLL